MRPSAPPCLHLLLAGTLALAATLRAESSTRSLSAEELCQTPLEDGDEVIVTGKYKELIDEELYLFNCELPLHITDDRLFAQLLGYTPKKDNVTVTGIAGRIRGERVIRVHKLTAAPTDFDLFRQEYLSLEKHEPGERVERLIDLGRRVLRANARESRPRLVSLSHRIFKDAVELEGDAEEGGIGKRIRLIEDVHEWLRDDAFTRDRLVTILEESPQNEPALEFLRELNCRKYDERWVTYEEYKKLEGLVQYEGGWVTPRELHHIRATEQFALQPKANLILLRRRTEKEYALLAEQGRVEPGMTREEVCLALGFPDFVLRRAHRKKEFDQWSYGSTYYYFYDGILVFVPGEN